MQCVAVCFYLQQLSHGHSVPLFEHRCKFSQILTSQRAIQFATSNDDLGVFPEFLSESCLRHSTFFHLQMSNALQHTATHRNNTLPQHTAINCNNTLQQNALNVLAPLTIRPPSNEQRTVTHCNAPQQHTATHCNTLQHTATTHCNTLQQTATQCQKRACVTQHPSTPE